MGESTMAELANCTRCDTLYVKTMRDICQGCYQEEEAAFKVVYRFLMDQKNREASMAEIVEVTGIDEALIIKFLKEGRLQASQFPNLAYACEQCGTPIVSGRICSHCTEQLKQALNEHEALQTKSQSKHKSDKDKTNTYYFFK